MSDVFGAETPAVITVDALVGEGKKFKTVDDLAKAKAESDNYIEQLKAENATARAAALKADTAQAELDTLREEIKALRSNANRETASKETTSPPLTADSIKALVTETLTQAERNRTSQQNIEAANAAMVAHYGSVDKATAAVQAKAQELGLSISDLKDTAAKSPTAFKKIVLGDAAPASASPLDTSGNLRAPEKALGNAPTPGSKEEFEALRKTSPKQYWKPEVQARLHAAVKAGTYQL